VATITAPIRVPVETDPAFEDFITRLLSIASVADGNGIDQPDLAYIVAILASTGWNRNDDIFTPSDLWAAKETPVHKPINVGHDQNEIIGHMVQARVLDKGGAEIVLPDDGAIPTDFDVEVAGVLYKELPPLAEKIAGIIAAARNGELFVSMECFFAGFDYGFQDPTTGAVKIVARSEQTAFLTKHLRVYGGRGEFQGFRVGRVLRDILFIGKGIVTKPANPDSVIKQVAAVAAASLNELKGGAEGMTNQNTQATETEVPVQVDETARAFEAAQAELEALKASSNEQVAALTRKVAEVEDTVVALRAENNSLQGKLDAAQAELAGIRKAEKARDRLADLSKVRTIEDEKATLAELAEMTDQTFALVLRYAGSAKAEIVNPTEKETTPTEPEEETTAALDTAEEEEDPDMQGGVTSASESIMAVASATAQRLLGREAK
jgi:hypothetical protein